MLSSACQHDFAGVSFWNSKLWCTGDRWGDQGAKGTAPLTSLLTAYLGSLWQGPGWAAADGWNAALLRTAWELQSKHWIQGTAISLSCAQPSPHLLGADSLLALLQVSLSNSAIHKHLAALSKKRWRKMLQQSISLFRSRVKGFLSLAILPPCFWTGWWSAATFSFIFFFFFL